MSGVVASRQGVALSDGTATGILVGYAALVLFSAAAVRLGVTAYPGSDLLAVWDHPGDTALIGGQWAMYGLVWLLRKLPGPGPISLVALTIAAAAAASGLMAHDLVKRGWRPVQAAFGVLLVCLNPVMLQLATSGEPALFQALGIAVVIVAVDRVEALNDAQSLIVLGLVLAVLLSLWPNACFFALPVATLLPFAFRDMKGYPAATALFVIAYVPSLILVLALLLGATLFGLPAADVLSVWSAPLHGLSPDAVAASGWLARYGGSLLAPWAILAVTCLLAGSGSVIIVVRLLTSGAERRRPATALAALLLPALAGALMTRFWELGSTWSVTGNATAAIAAWTVTTSLRRRERWFWIAAAAGSLLIGWLSPLLFFSPDAALWRAAILPSVAER